MQWMLWMMLVVFTAVAPSKTARPSTHTHILVNTENSSSSFCAPSVATGLQQKLTWRHTTMRNINPKNGILKFQGGRSRGASSSGGVNVHRCLRTSYIGSTSSFDSNAMSVKSYNSGSLVEVVQEPAKAAGMHQNILPTFLPSFAPTNRGSLDLFNPPVGPESHSSEASAIDLFQMPAESLAKMDCGGPSRCGMECSALVANNLGGYAICTTIGYDTSTSINIIDKQNPAKGVIVSMARKAPKHNCSLSVAVTCDLNGVTGLHLLETVGPCDYRTSYIGSTSSFDSNAMSVKSYNSGSLVEVVQEPPKAAGMHQNILPTFPPSFAPTNRGSLDLFNPLVGPESHSSEASAIDLFQMPAESLAKMVDLFKELPSNPVSSGSALPPSVDLFSGQSVTFSNEKSPEQLFPENEGWATFDSLQPLASTSGTENPMPSIIPSSVASSAGIDHVPSLPTNVQWPPFPHYSIQSSDPWHNNLDSNQASGSAAAGQLCDGMIFNHNLPRCFNCLDCGGPSRCGMECSALVANNLGDKQNPAKGVIVRMARKAPKHNCSLSVTVTCDLNAVTGLHSLETVGPCDYAAVLKHPSGCAVSVSNHGKGWGWFGTLMIIFACLFGGYLLAGTVFLPWNWWF